MGKNTDKLIALAEDIEDKLEQEIVPEPNQNMPIEQARSILDGMMKDMATLANLSAVLRSQKSELSSPEEVITPYDLAVTLHQLASAYVFAAKTIKQYK